MMKPDTPKFAEMPELDDPCINKETHLRKIREYSSEIASTRWSDENINPLKYLARKILERLDWYERAMISAAPQPDCVGVEELRLKLREVITPYNATNGFHIADQVIDLIMSEGLLAVKEKA